jgi:hypothetical protein
MSATPKSGDDEMARTTIEDQWTAPTRAEIDEALDALLSKGRIACDGDYPSVPPTTIGEMSQLFRLIASAVSEPDADGAFNFQIHVVDKYQQTAPANWVRAPLLVKTHADVIATIRAAESLSNAAGRLMAEAAAVAQQLSEDK